MAKYYPKKVVEEDPKTKKIEKEETAELIRKNLIAKEKISLHLKQLYGWLNYYACFNYMKPGISKDYFESAWYESFIAMVHKAFPNIETNYLKKFRVIDRVNHICKIKQIPYRVIWMNEMYSSNMYFYVYKIGRF